MLSCCFVGAQKCNRQVSGYEHFRDGRCVLFDEAEFTRQAALWDAQFERCVGPFCHWRARRCRVSEQPAAFCRAAGAPRCPQVPCPGCIWTSLLLVFVFAT